MIAISNYYRRGNNLSLIPHNFFPIIFLGTSRLVSSISMSSSDPFAPLSEPQAYTPPDFAARLPDPPVSRLFLSSRPTPIHPLVLPDRPAVVSKVLVKRDDHTGGLEMGGNKIRKLDFLLADALSRECGAVVTIGGVMSNHCRATACAARAVGIDPHLVLRTRESETDRLHGLVGNVLFGRLAAASVWTCTPGAYGRFGSHAILKKVAGMMEAERPYIIPVGGSNALGSWGYIEAVDELLHQMENRDMPDYIVLATGSGGTLAGIVVGLLLAEETGRIKYSPQIHAVGVCDNPEYFYKTVTSIITDMGYVSPVTKEDIANRVRRILVVHQGKGRGYAISTSEELNFVKKVAATTGLVLDPVYTGKALHHFLNVVVEQDKKLFEGKTVLYWHTGGGLGVFDKVPELQCWEEGHEESEKSIGKCGGELDVTSPIRKVDMYKDVHPTASS
uniref:Tryptophan synthase beta chain-like PALP domain-containing protein n=1 Tax=Corethron hystrix TaxID=216773 RepID=A0A7S1BJI2_9STRA|mmetsp:Transcript_30653/g.70161  ORF Transcript_30653/g.70161 Transcript_30653/m.70161 type:complete len:447 (+) Transcript_30653:57-1397(+)